MSLKLVTPAQRSRSWWSWYTMEFIKDDESDDRMYVKPEIVTWPVLMRHRRSSGRLMEPYAISYFPCAAHRPGLRREPPMPALELLVLVKNEEE